MTGIKRGQIILESEVEVTFGGRAMLRIPACVILIVSMSLPASMSAQTPKSERSVVGKWKLKSATVNGKNAPEGSKELDGLLKGLGGAEIGMVYKFRSGEGGCTLNDSPGAYIYHSKTKELEIDADDDDGKEIGVTFDVSFVDKNMKLRFKEASKGRVKGRTVEMTFTPE